jgi:hypothetical protein
MHRRLAVAALALAAVAAPDLVAAQARQDFSIVNSTGYQIDEIYVGPSSDPNWGRDLLGQNVLASGQTFNVTFPPATRECMFDIKVVYNDRDQTEWRQINLCQVSRMTLHWDHARRTTRAVME